MKSAQEMIALNRSQAEYYDSICAVETEGRPEGYSSTEKANRLTKIWAAMRYRQQLAVRQAGISETVRESIIKWSSAKAGGRFLEIGCFRGSALTMPLVEISGSYVGVELSPKAVTDLNNKFKAAGLDPKAKAIAVDFLSAENIGAFDVVYASGVLHHFENPGVLFERIYNLTTPDSLLIFVEPSQINPLYKTIRACYRPFQSDAGWEWPFSTRTVEALESRFEPVDGFGWGKWSLPLSVLTSAPVVGRFIASLYIRQVRSEMASKFGKTVWLNSYVAAAFRRKK